MFKNNSEWVLKPKLKIAVMAVLFIGIVICAAVLFPAGSQFLVDLLKRASLPMLATPARLLEFIAQIAAEDIGVMIFVFFILLVSQELKFNKNNITESIGNQKFSMVFENLFKVIILSSIVIRITMYIRGNSLWLDEAMLAESIIVRNINNLTAAPLSNDQTAPVLYLYTVKLLGMLFGYSENVLRVYSFIVFIGMLIAEWALLKNCFKIESLFVWAALCITSTLKIYMRYSNELKPYMGDAFWVVLLLYLYHLYRTTKIKTVFFTVLCCIALLFSSPVVFFAASIGIVEFISAIRAKNKKHLFRILFFGAAVSGVFIANYILWLMPVAKNPSMIDYWKQHRFNILPLSIRQLFINVWLIYSIMYLPSFIFTTCYTLLALAGLIISIRKKNKISFVVGLSGFLLLIASNFEKYPLVNRLNLFVYVLAIMYMSIFLDMIRSITINIKSGLISRFNLNIKPISLGLLFILWFIWINKTYIAFTVDGVYRFSEEANPLIEYVQKNIKEDESLYVYESSRHIVRYKNGYTSNRIGNAAGDNIIWGGERINGSKENQDSIKEFQLIVESKKCYLLFSHIGGNDAIQRGMEQLQQFGDIREVMIFQGTPLYYFMAK